MTAGMPIKDFMERCTAEGFSGAEALKWGKLRGWLAVAKGNPTRVVVTDAGLAARGGREMLTQGKMAEMMVDLKAKLGAAEKRMADMDPVTRKQYGEALASLAQSIELFARGDMVTAGVLFATALPSMVECERRLVVAQQRAEELARQRRELDQEVGDDAN